MLIIRLKFDTEKRKCAFTFKLFLFTETNIDIEKQIYYYLLNKTTTKHSCEDSVHNKMNALIINHFPNNINMQFMAITN